SVSDKMAGGNGEYLYIDINFQSTKQGDLPGEHFYGFCVLSISFNCTSSPCICWIEMEGS
ncbi:TPA: hypothetical protein ACJJY9_003718, partial [Enterobacter hormaechei subsp. xiangfangensis]